MQLLLAASNQIAANNQSLKHHVYAVENVNILHLPKHEIVKSTHWSNVMSSLKELLDGDPLELQNPAHSAKGEERRDHEQNPWLVKMDLHSLLKAFKLV